MFKLFNNIKNFINRRFIEIEEKEEDKKYISAKKIKQISLTYSKILNCKINNKEVKKLFYRSVLTEIYKIIPIDIIFKNTTFNFTKGFFNQNGYNYCKDIDASFQSKDATDTFKEIINMIELQKINFEISIKLKNGDIIHFKN